MPEFPFGIAVRDDRQARPWDIYDLDDLETAAMDIAEHHTASMYEPERAARRAYIRWRVLDLPQHSVGYILALDGTCYEVTSLSTIEQEQVIRVRLQKLTMDVLLEKADVAVTSLWSAEGTPNVIGDELRRESILIVEEVLRRAKLMERG